MRLGLGSGEKLSHASTKTSVVYSSDINLYPSVNQIGTAINNC